MKFCPKCNLEATDFEYKCPNCDLTLVTSNESPLENEEEINSETIHTDYLIPAIISSLFFFITGIVSVIYAVKANSADKYGDEESAIEYSFKSRNFFIFSFIIFFVLLILKLIL